MSPDQITHYTAWSGTVVLTAQVSVGRTIVRRSRRAEGCTGVCSRSLGFVLGSHVFLGIALLPMSFAHMWFSMKMPSIRTANAVGLWIASAALLLLGVQILLGNTLIQESATRRSSLRKTHFALGIAVVSLVGLHVVLNG